jgi:hypothetical protein
MGLCFHAGHDTLDQVRGLDADPEFREHLHARQGQGFVESCFKTPRGGPVVRLAFLDERPEGVPRFPIGGLRLGRLQLRLAIFAEEVDDFEQVGTQLIERRTLRMGARPAGYLPNKKAGVPISLDYRSVGAHGNSENDSESCVWIQRSANRAHAPVLLQRDHGIAREARIQQSAVNSNDRYALARRAGRVAASRSTATRSAR